MFYGNDLELANRIAELEVQIQFVDSIEEWDLINDEITELRDELDSRHLIQE